MNAKDIFLRAIEIDSDDERRAFLDEACDGDANLRRRVEALIAAHDDPESYLDRPAARFDVAETTDGTASGLSDSSSHHGRFLPGTKIAGRYRIVSLLGRGGMGEVYRADDLRLGQPVALKFLPSELAKDPKRLEYFHNEVRLARQISHPNVCRVYDIGEVDGQHFISMEYIDGEDLKVLLHRIGRLPNDKGAEIAQQLCAGLAAAHARGVLHRDLKPANIMLDGQGQVRITDFGLASTARDDHTIVGMSGTPAYMAPEQLLRGQTSIQSDIFSFGLVLYELFTGKPAFQAGSLPELRRMHEGSSSPARPSTVIDDVDPAVERTILKCLEHDPLDRPASAIEISTALPGGNPLAAALAAGETPSPELVAASGEHGGISKRAGWVLFAATVISLLASFWLADRALDVNHVKFRRDPDYLKYKGLQLLEELGYADSVRKVRTGFSKYATATKPGQNIGQTSELGATIKHQFSFWVRTSPNYFDRSVGFGGVVESRIYYDETPWNVAGMTGVRFDPDGRLLEFRAVPQRSIQPELTSEPPAWSEWFTEEHLGFPLNSLTSSRSVETPPVIHDRVQSWEGSAGNGSRIHVQAASYRGRPVYLAVVPIDEDFSIDSSTGSQLPPWMYIGLADLILALILGSRNWYTGRGDRRGAMVVAVITFLSGRAGSWALSVHHEGGLLELKFFIAALGSPLFFAAWTWLRYIALEPAVRRFSPEIVVSWTRLLRGDIRNPSVGRDVLIGLFLGALYRTIRLVTAATSGDLVESTSRSLNSNIDVIGVFANLFVGQFNWSLVGIFFFSILQRLIPGKHAWVAGLVVVLAIFWLPSVFDGTPASGIMLKAMSLSLMALAAMRFGFLSLLAYGFFTCAMQAMPMTSDLSTFYFQRSLLLSVAIVAVTAAAFCGATTESPGRARRNSVTSC